MGKVHSVVEQECNCCGKHFYLKYYSDGTYEYVGEPCACEADFSPADEKPSISEWMDCVENMKATSDYMDGYGCVYVCYRCNRSFVKVDEEQIAEVVYVKNRFRFVDPYHIKE